MMLRTSPLAAIFVVFFFPSLIYGEECLTVRGRVKCDHRHKNQTILVKLFDEDTKYHDLMDEGYASKNGAFQLHGCASDVFSKIDPILVIYHKCKGTKKHVILSLDQAHIGSIYTFDKVIQLDQQFDREEDEEYDVPKCAGNQPKAMS